MRTLSLAMVALLSGPARAQDVVATLYTHNGTVAPPYHRSLRAIITADGMVALRACKGYDDSACSTFTGAAPEGAVAAILGAAKAAGLPGQPLTEDPMPPVGGGSTSGSVVIGGQSVALPAFPVEGDRTRTEAVLSAIRQSIPSGVQARAEAKIAE
jgi:hypothetical protein